MVEWFCLKPCWKFIVGMRGEMCFRINFSSSLHKEDSSDIGLYEAGFFGSFPDLSLGMILALFHD